MAPDYRRPGTTREQIDERRIEEHLDEIDRRRKLRVEEPSDWPPPVTSAPDEAETLRPRRRTHPTIAPPPASIPPPPSIPTVVARRFGHVKEIVSAIALLVGIAMAIWGWAKTKATEELIGRLDPAVFKPAEPKLGSNEPRLPSLSEKLSAHEAKLAELAKVTDAAARAPNDPRSDLGTKLDRIDQILSKHFGESTRTVPPPSVGPTAKQTGRQ